MVGSAIIGGVLLALIEGMSIIFMHYTSEQFRPMSPLEDPTPLGAVGGSLSSSESISNSPFSSSASQFQ